MMDLPSPLDIPFHVPFLHRLRFTRDVLGDDRHVLADVLQPSEERPVRVQLWVDRGVVQARADFLEKLLDVTRAWPDRIEVVGDIQEVPGGERIKNDIHILENILKAFQAADLDRRSYVVVIGGGAVLDAVGFAAAIAHRGIRLVRLPTTTLSQADSGVGVKNGVNLFENKNWVGSFAVPWAVINDTELLSSLTDRDFIAGFAEAVKVSLLKDAAFFDRLCGDAKRIGERDPEVAVPAIARAARLHLEHITRGGDPFEMLEARPLDFGHWSAHRLEVLSDFELRHGEAVAIGVAVDTLYSSLVHGMPREEAERVIRCLGNLGLPLDHRSLHVRPEILFQGLEEFRQHLGGRLTLTLLRGVGDPIDVHRVERSRMLEAIEELTRILGRGGFPKN